MLCKHGLGSCVGNRQKTFQANGIEGAISISSVWKKGGIVRTIVRPLSSTTSPTPRKDSQNRRFKPISEKPGQQSPAKNRHGDEVQQAPRRERRESGRRRSRHIAPDDTYSASDGLALGFILNVAILAAS